jgi:hypothetical protein
LCGLARGRKRIKGQDLSHDGKERSQSPLIVTFFVHEKKEVVWPVRLQYKHKSIFGVGRDANWLCNAP